MNSTRSWTRTALAIAGALTLVFATSAAAQVQTDTTTSHGAATHEQTITTAQVVYVSGNDVVVKMQDGSLRHFNNVPASFRVNVNGQQLGVHDLKPGMTITRTVVQTTTPTVITTTQSVTGKVWHVNPPLSVILTLADGKNQEFKIPNGQKFNVDGQMVDAWGLKKGMTVSATKVVEVPQTTVSQHTSFAGTAPPPPPPQDQPILVAVVTPMPAPAPAAAPAPAPAPASLPKTGSELPLIGLLGLMCLGSSFGLRLLKR
jgi:LPXTG-motif cell wall-anchored protein